jgi:hypothetical protein
MLRVSNYAGINFRVGGRYGRRKGDTGWNLSLR